MQQSVEVQINGSTLYGAISLFLNKLNRVLRLCGIYTEGFFSDKGDIYALLPTGFSLSHESISVTY